jgi:hypothetical protein
MAQFVFQYQRQVITTESFFRVVEADTLDAARAIASNAIDGYNHTCPDDIDDDGEGQDVGAFTAHWAPGAAGRDHSILEDQREDAESEGYFIAEVDGLGFEARTPTGEIIIPEDAPDDAELLTSEAEAWGACVRHLEQA